VDVEHDCLKGIHKSHFMYGVSIKEFCYFKFKYLFHSVAYMYLN